MKNFINKLGAVIVIVSIIGRMTLRFFAPEHVFAIHLLWFVAGAAALLCLWSASEMRKEEKENNGKNQNYAFRLFLTDLIMVILYVLATIFMFLK